MGTSQSSAGPGANVSLVPPWAEPAPDPADPAPAEAVPTPDPETLPGLTLPPTPNVAPVAPDRRFVSARRNLGAFAKTGDAVRMRRGVAHSTSWWRRSSPMRMHSRHGGRIPKQAC